MSERVGKSDPAAAQSSSKPPDSQPKSTSQRDTKGDGSATRSPSGPADPKPDVPERFGRYNILRKLGQGGMGAVYLAHDTQLDRQVALKVPRFDPEDGPEILGRFNREAKVAATLQHPNLCPVFDVGQIDGVHYISMAYIEGRPLSTFIRSDKPVPQRHAAALVRKLAATLHEAHARGVIHRDLKPANIMIDQRREPIIMDFGLARREGSQETRLTRTGAIIGTPAYMAPEQIKSGGADVGPSCDIYAIGVILYELLTGRLPFEGNSLAMLGQILTAEPEPPSSIRNDVPTALEIICLKAMAKDPKQRYASMTELAQALGDYLRRDSSRTGAIASENDAERQAASALFEGMAVSEAELPPVVLRGRTKKGSKRGAVSNHTRLWIAGAFAIAAVVGVVIFAGRNAPWGTDEITRGEQAAANPDGAISGQPEAAGPQVQPVDVAASAPPSNPSAEPSLGAPTAPEGISLPDEPKSSAVPDAKPPPPAAPPTKVKTPRVPQTLIVGSGPGEITLDKAFFQARRGDTIEIRTDDPIFVDADALIWKDSGEGDGPLTLRAGDGFQPIIALREKAIGGLLIFQSPLDRVTQPIVLEGLTLVSISGEGQGLDPAVSTNGSLEIRRCVIASFKRGVFCDSAAAGVECVIQDSYLWRIPASSKLAMAIVSWISGKLTLENNLIVGAMGPHVGSETTSTDIVSRRNTYLQCGGQFVLSRQSAIESRQNLFAGMKYVTNLLGDEAATLSSAQGMLKSYQGRQNLYYGGLWVVHLNSAPRQAKDISLWQQLTDNGEKGVLLEDPKFLDARFPGIAEQVLLPPRAFKLQRGSRIRSLSIGADLSKIPEPPPNLQKVLSAEFLPTADMRRTLSQSAFK